ncbi:MAG: insulinase family protein, partial [Bacteroidia bacterium]|nr:insulinase family protein [Bacteroidia bacterium]
LDRTQAPAFKTIDNIDVERVKRQKLDNGIELYSLSAGSQEITKLEFIFRAGMFHQPATLIASSTNSLLESGTKSFTADELSNGIDYFGSFIEFQVDQDYASVTLYSLNKYLEDSLKFVEEIIKSPLFPESEFRIHITNKKQKHLINSQKVNVLARRKFVELLFGPEHPYGIDVKESDFDRINIAELKDFFANYYTSQNCTIIASGNLPKGLVAALNKHFGNASWGKGTVITEKTFSLNTSTNHKFFVEKSDAIQSAVRVGRILFNKTHPDYFKFQVLNTILGGYFGSRLMANIREDKGYTYGIGSGLNSLVHSGYFFISTEVGADVTNQTLEEIYKELKLLRDDLIGDDELETVRNYILGNFLRSVDGPFALADKFKSIWEFGLDYSYFDEYFKAVKTVTSKELRDLANKYLLEKDLIECVAGKKE